jgi:hypothetical protein
VFTVYALGAGLGERGDVVWIAGVDGEPMRGAPSSFCHRRLHPYGCDGGGGAGPCIVVVMLPGDGVPTFIISSG